MHLCRRALAVGHVTVGARLEQSVSQSVSRYWYNEVLLTWSSARTVAAWPCSFLLPTSYFLPPTSYFLPLTYLEQRAHSGRVAVLRGDHQRCLPTVVGSVDETPERLPLQHA